MNRVQWMALRLAAFPMTIGVVSLLLWKLTHWGPLLIGYGFLAIGLMAALFVPFLLWKAWVQSPNLRATLLIGGLAVANLPVTFICIDSGLARTTRYEVTLRNDADSEWTGLQLVTTRLDIDLGTLAPKNMLHRDVWFSADGSLKLHYLQGGEQQTVVVEGYVTHGIGGAAFVVRDADGAITVKTR